MSAAERAQYNTIVQSTKGTLKARLPRQSHRQLEALNQNRTKVVIKDDSEYLNADLKSSNRYKTDSNQESSKRHIALSEKDNYREAEM